MTSDRTAFGKPATDMTGWNRDGWTVIERAPTIAKTARWRAKHSCGAEHIVDGSMLRSHPTKFCDSCRPTGKGARGPRRKA